MRFDVLYPNGPQRRLFTGGSEYLNYFSSLGHSQKCGDSGKGGGCI